MTAMSGETRSTVAATLYLALGKMKVEMEMMEDVIGEEVMRQLALETMSLKALYWRTPTPKRMKTDDLPSTNSLRKSQEKHAGGSPICSGKKQCEETTEDESSDGDSRPGLIEGIDYF